MKKVPSVPIGWTHVWVDPGDKYRLMISDPQAHIDALVEAGVLDQVVEINGGYIRSVNGEAAVNNHRTLYAVVQPHVHEWRVRTWGVTAERCPRLVRLRCDCGDEMTAPNRLPIEVPE